MIWWLYQKHWFSDTDIHKLLQNNGIPVVQNTACWHYLIKGYPLITVPATWTLGAQPRPQREA